MDEKILKYIEETKNIGMDRVNMSVHVTIELIKAIEKLTEKIDELGE